MKNNIIRTQMNDLRVPAHLGSPSPKTAMLEDLLFTPLPWVATICQKINFTHSVSLFFIITYKGLNFIGILDKVNK